MDQRIRTEMENKIMEAHFASQVSGRPSDEEIQGMAARIASLNDLQDELVERNEAVDKQIDNLRFKINELKALAQGE